MTRLSPCKGVTVSGMVLLTLLGLRQTGQAATVIRHTPVSRLPNNAHPQITAIIESEDPLASARLFFRASGEPEFHYVEMGPGSEVGTASGVLPIPEAGTVEIEYYIVASTNGSDNAWTRMHRAATTSVPVPDATYAGGTPEIWIGKVGGTSSDLPAGFQLVGVAGILHAIGGEPAPPDVVETPVAESPAPVDAAISDDLPLDSGTSDDNDEGGGVALGPVAAVGALAVAGAGVAVLTGSDATVENVPDTADELAACFTMAPKVISQGGSVQLNAHCSSPRDAISRYRWDLGNGDTLDGETVTATYQESGSFQILLTVSNAVRSNSSSQRIEVLEGPPPLAACITAEPPNGRVKVGEAIRFDGSCSQPIASITGYQWNLGDGRLRDGRVVSATYSAPGDYTVALTVSDNAETHTSSFEVTIEARIDLNACFVTEPPNPLEGDLIEFDASCSSPAGGIASYEWDLGDGRTASGRVVTATYDTADTYSVGLTVSDGEGLATITQDVVVTENVIVPCFVINPSSPGNVYALGQGVELDASCSSGRVLENFDWDIDGDPQTGQTVPITFGKVKEDFSIKLTVSGGGVTERTSRNVRVRFKNDLGVAMTRTPLQPIIFLPPGGIQRFTVTASSAPGNDPFPVTLEWRISGLFTVGVSLVTVPSGASCSPASNIVSCNWAATPTSSTVVIDAQMPSFFPLFQTYVVTASILPTSTTIIDENPGNNDADLSFTFQRSPSAGNPELRTSFVSSLDAGVADGSLRGRITLNESSSVETDNSGPHRHQLMGRAGENRVLAERLTGGAEGQWRFDFFESPGFVSGSLSMRQGQLISSGPRVLVFRTSGAPGELIEFSYRLESSP